MPSFYRADPSRSADSPGPTWSRFGALFVSMRAEKFIVSAKKQKWGRLSPMMPPGGIHTLHIEGCI